jgi:outer membrane receptor for ferrienterochelin and colicins
MGARTLDDVLKSIPGLHVAPSSLSRLDSVYSIRGIHTGFNSQVLVLVNGVAVQSTFQGGHPAMLRIPAVNIARVEVMRGPGSAIYGADAYAGVINVITKDSSSIETTKIAGSVGSFGAHEISLLTATEWNGIAIALNVAYQETDGDDSRRVNSDFQTSMDAALKTKASLAPGALSTRYQVLDTHLAISGDRWQFNLWNWLSTDAGIGAGGAQALDYEGHDDNHLVMADATYHFSESGHDWDNSIRLSNLYSDHTTSFVLFPAGAKLPIGSDGNVNFAKPVGVVSFPDGLRGEPGQVTNDAQLEFISIYNGWDDHRLRFSAGSRYQTYNGSENKNFGTGVINGTQPVVDGRLTGVDDTPYIFLADHNRTVKFLSLQDEWKLLADLTLTAGLRYDNYSDFGDTTNPRFALVWGVNEDLTAKLLYGSAFRAPSFSDLGQANNPVSLGNPNLNPERIDTVELAFNYRFNQNLQANLTLFDYEATDVIEFLADANGVTKTAQNARDQNGEGYELELSWKPTAQLRFGSSYSKQDADDAKTHIPIADAPRKQFKLNADWEFTHNWFLNTQLDWVADRPRARGDKRKPIADYTWVNLTLRAKDIAPNLDLSLAVRNATDENVREPSTTRIPEDYPMESRSGWVELIYSF